jgi:hypothetical protein
MIRVVRLLTTAIQFLSILLSHFNRRQPRGKQRIKRRETLTLIEKISREIISTSWNLISRRVTLPIGSQTSYKARAR